MGLSKSKISDEKLLAVLTVTPTVTAAAAAAGVGQRTIYRRLQNPEFRRQLEEQRLKSLETARNGFLARLMDAVDTISGVMMNGENRPETRLRAAGMMIDAGLRLVEVTDIEKRLDALERREMA